jgi:glycosyltransferase involved in cell wall biosynthesis
MKNKKTLVVWVLQTGEPLPTDKNISRPMRAINLTNKLIEKGHKVILWSSSFNHQIKEHRSKDYKQLKVNENLEIRLIPSCGYKKHISINRLIDHAQLGYNLKKILKKERNKPDVAFLGFPPIEINLVMSNWLSRNKIPFLVDVKDLWPDALIENYSEWKKKVLKIFLFFYYLATKKIYNQATGLTGITDKFLKKIEDFSQRKTNKFNKVFPTVSDLTVKNYDLSSIENWWYDMGVYDDNIFKVVYVGNLSSNIDLLEIKKAAQSFKKKDIKIQFIICGSGDHLQIFKDMMHGLDNVIFPGRVNKEQVSVLARRSNAWLIPYFNNENLQLGLPNKTFDALYFGIPILSSLEGGIKNLIIKNEIGMFYDKINTLEKCIIQLQSNPKLHTLMSINAKKLYGERFEFNMIYDELVCHLENIALKKDDL